MAQLLARLVGALSDIRGVLVALCAAALIAGGAAAAITHRLDQAAIAALALKDQEARTEAIQDAARVRQSQDQANLDAALAEAKAQARIVTHTVTITREIPVHVPDRSDCIPYGLVRVLDAAATGADAAGPAAAAGQPDEACAPLSWRDLAAQLSDDYGAGRANAEQLNALQADVRALTAAANAAQARKDEP